MNNKLKGLYTAVITPFNEDGSIDWASFSSIVENQVSSGVDGILFAGTTGESPTLTNDELFEIFRKGVKMVNKRCKVILGTGTNDTHDCIVRAKVAEEVEADAQLVVNPYYNKPTQEGLYKHFSAIANASNVPVILYNIKARTGVNIETPTLLRLAENPNIVGVKEASGDIGQMMDVIRKVRSDFSVLVGDDALTLPFMAAGGDGLISVISNCVPRTMTTLVHTCLRSEILSARKLFYNLIDIMQLSFSETNPIPVKEVMAALGWCKPVFRLPMCNASMSTMEKISEIVDFIKDLEAID